MPTTAASTEKPTLPSEKQATTSTASTPQVSTSPPLRLITSSKPMSPSPLSPSRRSPTSPSYRYQVDSSQAPSPSSRTRRRSFLLGGAAASTSGSSSTPQKTLRCNYRGGCISPCFLRNLCPKHYTQSLREGRSSAVIAEGPRIASPAPSPNRRGSFKKPEHPIDGLVVAPTRGLLPLPPAYYLSTTVQNHTSIPPSSNPTLTTSTSSVSSSSSTSPSTSSTSSAFSTSASTELDDSSHTKSVGDESEDTSDIEEQDPEEQKDDGASSLSTQKTTGGKSEELLPSTTDSKLVGKGEEPDPTTSLKKDQEKKDDGLVQDSKENPLTSPSLVSSFPGLVGFPISKTGESSKTSRRYTIVDLLEARELVDLEPFSDSYPSVVRKETKESEEVIDSSDELAKLLLHKIRLCSVILEDNRDEENPPPWFVSAKEVKRKLLAELLTFVVSTPTAWTNPILTVAFQMITHNVLRPLPPFKPLDPVPGEGEGGGGGDKGKKDKEDKDTEETDGEEESESVPHPDPRWDSNQHLYDLLLRITQSDADSALLLAFFSEKWLTNLLELFRSEDPRERNILTKVLLLAYEKFFPRRAFIRQAIGHVLQLSIHSDLDQHCGLPNLLEVIESVVEGLSKPLKEVHRIYLLQVILPLHKSPEVANFHGELSRCVGQFIDKDPQLSTPVLEALMRTWPRTNSAKEVLYITEVEELLEMIPNPLQNLQQILPPLFKQLARCINSPHFQVAAQTLFLWQNETVCELIADARQTLLPLIYPALVQSSETHWDFNVRDLAMNVVKGFHELDPELSQQCAADYAILRKTNPKLRELKKDKKERPSVLDESETDADDTTIEDESEDREQKEQETIEESKKTENISDQSEEIEISESREKPITKEEESTSKKGSGSDSDSDTEAEVQRRKSVLAEKEEDMESVAAAARRRQRRK